VFGGGARYVRPAAKHPIEKGPLPQGGPRTALGEGAAGVGALAAAQISLPQGELYTLQWQLCQSRTPGLKWGQTGPTKPTEYCTL